MRLPAIVPSLAATAVAKSTAILSWPGDVDVQRPSIQVTAIQRGNGSVSLTVIAHFHERKASGPAGVPVGNNVHLVDSAVRLEQRPNATFGSIKTEIPYENILHLNLLSEICRAANAGTLGG
jgi:hypothetical protein